jgi:hypothetical protein
MVLMMLARTVKRPGDLLAFLALSSMVTVHMESVALSLLYMCSLPCRDVKGPEEFSELEFR